MKISLFGINDIREHINKIKFMASQSWTNFDWLSQKVILIIFTVRHKTYCMTLLRGRLVPMTSLVQRAAENNMGRIGFWSILMRFWSNTMSGCFGTGFSNHQGTLGITAPSAKISKAAGRRIMRAEQVSFRVYLNYDFFMIVSL